MKKNCTVIFLAIVLLLITACGREDPDAAKASAPLTTGISAGQTDRGPITDKNSGVVFRVNTELKGELSPLLTDNDCIEVSIKNKNYYFPFVTRGLENAGWTYQDSQGEAIEHMYVDTEQAVSMVSPEKEVLFKVKKIGMVAEPAGGGGESLITDIVLPGGDSPGADAWVLPGGITAKSTAADVLSVFGDPNKTDDFSEDSGNTEDTLLYKSGKKTGLSYAFRFEPDGGIAEVELSRTEEDVNGAFTYENEYFSVQLPGFWQGRYEVVKEGDKCYWFRFKEGEGGRLFSILISETEEHDPNCYVIGLLTGNGHTYEIAYYVPSDDQTPKGCREEFSAMNTALSLPQVIGSLKAADGYTYQDADYSSYVGLYGQSVSDTGDIALEIESTDGATVTFSLGYYSVRRIAELQHIRVGMSQGKGRFFNKKDGRGVYCDGYIRLENGRVFVDVDTSSMSDSQSLIQTNGEIELLKRDSSETEISSGEGTLTIDENVTQYLDWTYGDIVEAFGDDYYLDEYHHLRYDGADIAFQGEDDFNSGVYERIYTVIIRGSHELGSGISSDMTLSEITDVFGGTEFPAERSDGSYSLVVYKDGYCYGYIWNTDYDRPSDIMYIYKG